MSEYQLTQGIIALSESEIWDAARLEWELETVFEDPDYSTCLCGHYPIKELCIIRNEKNGNEATVGNCCVKKFMGLPSQEIAAAVKRVKGDIDKSLNGATIELAYKNDWIDDWEYEFYYDIMRKRNISSKVLKCKRDINEKIINIMKNPELATNHMIDKCLKDIPFIL